MATVTDHDVHIDAMGDWLQSQVAHIIDAIEQWRPPDGPVESKLLAWFDELDWTITEDMGPQEIESFSCSIGCILGAAAMADQTVTEMLDAHDVPLDVAHYQDKRARATRIFDEDPQRAGEIFWNALDTAHKDLDALIFSMRDGDMIMPMRGAERVCRRLLAIVHATYGPGGCGDPQCVGWAHFNLGEAREGVERCDECDLYASDDEAAIAHQLHCGCGMGARKRAQRCHSCGKPRLGANISDWRESDHRLVCPTCIGE